MSTHEEQKPDLKDNVEEIRTNALLLDGALGYSTLNDPAQKFGQFQFEGNIGYMGCLKKDNLEEEKPNINYHTNLNLQAGMDVQKAELTYFGLSGAEKNSKGQIFGGGFGLTIAGTHRKDAFVDYTKTVQKVKEGDKEFAETGNHCWKMYKIDVNNKWSLGAGVEAFAFQKINPALELKQKVHFDYTENSGFGKDYVLNRNRGNETAEDYVNNNIPEGVTVVKGLSPFNTLIECSAEWKPVKSFRNLSFCAKAGVHLNGTNPYPIVGGSVKIGL